MKPLTANQVGSHLRAHGFIMSHAVGSPDTGDEAAQKRSRTITRPPKENPEFFYVGCLQSKNRLYLERAQV